MTTFMPGARLSERNIGIKLGDLGNLPHSVGVEACGWGQVIYDGNDAIGAILDPHLSLDAALEAGKVSPAALAIELSN